MFVTLEARTSCGLCGYQIRVTMCGTARVNKRSMRVEPTLGWQAYREREDALELEAGSG